MMLAFAPQELHWIAGIAGVAMKRLLAVASWRKGETVAVAVAAVAAAVVVASAVERWG